MYLRHDSAAGVRFLAAVKEGRGLKPSARAAGIGKQTGYRWLRESFVMLREKGLSVEAAQSELGFVSPRPPFRAQDIPTATLRQATISVPRCVDR